MICAVDYPVLESFKSAFAVQDVLEVHAELAKFQVSSLAETEEARQIVLKVPGPLCSLFASVVEMRKKLNALCHHHITIFRLSCFHGAAMESIGQHHLFSSQTTLDSLSLTCK